MLAASLPSVRRVINATGIVLHTGLGRAPLCEAALDALVEVGRGYCNLEYELDTGKRGKRQAHVAGRLAELTGAEAATVVNNNAAATLLILHTFARGREAIVSRGQLVEIGGSYRLPAIMDASGAIMCEVGTTNRTRISDYEQALKEDTALLLRVHTSNYRIIGFTETPTIGLWRSWRIATRSSRWMTWGVGRWWTSPGWVCRLSPRCASPSRRGPTWSAFPAISCWAGLSAGLSWAGAP